MSFCSTFYQLQQLLNLYICSLLYCFLIFSLLFFFYYSSIYSFPYSQVLVKYIIDFGTASQDSVAQAAAQAAAQKHALAVQKFEALKAQNLLKKQLKRDQLTKCLGRQKMIDHFVKRCNDIVQDLNKDNVVLRSRLFYLEQQQFGQGLPMYARKAEF